MKHTIYNRLTGEAIVTVEIKCSKACDEATRLGFAVVAAVDSQCELTFADLSGANLSLANLAGAFFTNANLKGTSLRGANLTRAWLP